MPQLGDGPSECLGTDGGYDKGTMDAVVLAGHHGNTQLGTMETWSGHIFSGQTCFLRKMSCETSRGIKCITWGTDALVFRLNVVCEAFPTGRGANKSTHGKHAEINCVYWIC